MKVEHWTLRIVILAAGILLGAQLGMKQERDNRPLCVCDPDCTENEAYVEGYFDAWDEAVNATDSLVAARWEAINR